MALTESKPFASLGPTLLARKGGAKPAMRPQLAAAAQHEPVDFAQDLEDLGWNDMGDEDDERRETALVALTPARHPHEVSEADIPASAAEPEVRRQQRAIAETMAAPGEAPAPYDCAPVDDGAANAPAVDSEAFESAPFEPAPLAPRALAGDSRRAAFTLRLDAKRHLALRLASTVKNRSAQALVTQALDRFLAGIPEIEALAAQLNRD